MENVQKIDIGIQSQNRDLSKINSDSLELYLNFILDIESCKV